MQNSGKMVLLDKLLKRSVSGSSILICLIRDGGGVPICYLRLQSGGNRVLIFSQMTRMLDILEVRASRFRSDLLAVTLCAPC